MTVKESGEMYLESILILSNRKADVRSVDVSEFMGYSKPSVSRAMKILKENGFVTVDTSGHVKLTETGQAIASNIYEKHVVLSDLFISLGVDEDIAVKDACRIEHVISKETFEAIKKIISESEKRKN